MVDAKECIIFDVETSGLPIKKSFDEYYPVNDNSKYNSSRIVSIAWGIYNMESGELQKMEYHIIKPEGFTIGQKSIEFHKITQEHALQNGHDIGEVFEILDKDIDGNRFLIAHNLRFDCNIVLNEAHRLGKRDLMNRITRSHRLCTGEATRDLLNITAANGFLKMPRLDELYRWCSRRDIEDAHNSKRDVENLSSVFFFLKKHYSFDGNTFSRHVKDD